MEHRCTERYSGDLKILIHKHNLPIAIGRIRNGSRLGIFVETDFADIACEQQLKLEVMASRQNRQPPISMSAIVIYKTDKGFGAELDIESFEQTNLFMEMLRGNFRPQKARDIPVAIAVNG